MAEDDKLLLEAKRAFELSDLNGALIAADELLNRDPKQHEALFIAAGVFMRNEQYGLAAQLLNVASQIFPEQYAIWHNLAVCVGDRHPEEAYDLACKAHALNPYAAECLITLSNLASQIGRPAQALNWVGAYIERYGQGPEIANNASFALFHLGRWEEGWKAFRASLGSEDRVSRNYTAGETPRWDPEADEGETVVIYGEQGIGDELMYAAMLRDAIAAAEKRATRVIIECDGRLEGLFKRSFPQATVHGTRGARYVTWAADERPTRRLEMGGLGEFFAAKPRRGPGYMQACPARRAMWQRWLDKQGRGLPRIGIAWTGGSWKTQRHRRSVPFEDIRRLMLGQAVDFVNLEYEPRRAELETAPVPVLNPEWATKKGADYDDTAALVSECDLVISATTSVVDLCGALGVPVWVMCDATPQWRYSEEAGADKMWWYESAKVYRQAKIGEWGPVVQQIGADLRTATLGRRR